MELKGAYLLLGILLLVNWSLQQASQIKRPVENEPEEGTDPAIQELQKQIDDIMQELILLREQQALQAVCLKGVKIHGKCFLADPLKKRYHVASEDCNNLGGVLSSPMSNDENDQLGDYVRQSIGPDEQIWLGVNDMLTEGSWTDQTGFSVAYENWDTSNYRSPQPDGGMSQNCAALSGASGGRWFDDNCREEKASVCQFNIV